MRLWCAALLLLAVEASGRGPPQHQDEVYSSAKPYGHTSHVHPYHASRDRQWYVEARWQPGQAYAPQDGPITNLPAHAPVPENYDAQADRPLPKRRRRLMNKPKVRAAEEAAANQTNKTARAAHADMKVPKFNVSKGNGSAVDAAASQANLTGIDKADMPHGKLVKLKNPRRVPVKQEPKYAVPKPDGHTSQVHPFHGNRDREWYVEGRWKPGTEYKPQDGPITENPKHAL